MCIERDRAGDHGSPASGGVHGEADRAEEDGGGDDERDEGVGDVAGEAVVEPGEPGSGFVFEDKIVGGVVPREFIKPVEAGIREALEGGIIAGYPMVDVKVQLVFGSYHDVDSSETAFKIAGSMAIKEAVKQAGGVILEPIMDVEVVSPEDFLGSVIGDLSSRRGKVGGMSQRGESQVVTAHVPLAEMFGYSTTLRSATQGRAVYTMQFHHYEEVPKAVAEQIISKATGSGR